ncbi:MAG: hypothetical protein II875_13415 [Clostridia bacterium]|nr:hypothetical protein [Clostridia bacterium]
MGRAGYDGPEKFRPLSALGYIGYTILFAIPVLGLVLLLVFSFSGKNINRRNFARSYLWVIFIFVIVFVILIRGNFGGFKNKLLTDYPKLEKVINLISGTESKVRELTDDIKGRDKAEPDERSKDEDGSKPANEATTEATVASTTKTATATPVAITATPKAVAATPKAVTPTPKPTPTKNTNTSGVRKEVKEAIDGYEKYFNEYAEFMKKYSDSPDNIGMHDYYRLLASYKENMEAWDSFPDDNDLNNAELKYYTDAQIRINRVLLDVLQ